MTAKRLNQPIPALSGCRLPRIVTWLTDTAHDDVSTLGEDAMRLAVYNVENLFDRAKAMNLESWAEGRPVLERFAALNALLGQPGYSAADKARMVALIVELGLENSDTGPFVLLRRNRGGLLKRPKTGGVEIVADGRADWVGSLELRDEPIDEHAMRSASMLAALGITHADWLEVVRGLVAQGVTVVSVLHEIGMALHADRVAVMAQGQLVHHGASGDAATHEALVQVFDGRIAIHALAGQWVALPVTA